MNIIKLVISQKIDELLYCFKGKLSYESYKINIAIIKQSCFVYIMTTLVIDK